MFNSNCASVPLVASIDGGYGGNNGFLNGDGLWGLIIILALLGWGGNGFGGFGGGFGGGGAQRDYVLATDFATIERKLDSVNSGICDATFALNNTIVNGNNALNNTITQGFAGLNTGMITQGYESRLATNALGMQLADCCCKTNNNIERGFADVNYNLATQACDTRHAIADSTRQILDFLTTDKIATLQAENQSLRLKASQEAQNNFLIEQLAPKCPQPAYVVQPPQNVTFPTNCCGQFSGYGNYGYNNGCGCGCA